ncbi:GNAT family N-acetyltransferase [Flavobacterium plurextorum]|uniref:GNAT family N-acetyltransferase n=1 Tax=Flavobacterium TaxID=237 RepID=UPI000C1786B0|nr:MULTISPECIES: GNAT family N-acetyltransferase [Flavobacterium]PIF60361.1 acetyltransferase (GNAT) family protein [Flavobacterium sp. 2]UUW10861.1 GNAT family N-acetyltransferase [Flavobacterium plurextorum]
MNIIKEIPSKETYIVRQPVLRKGKPIESCIFEGDDLETTHHFGLFQNENLTGIISLFTQSNPIFAENLQGQIRGMAILENHQKKGFGEALVKHCEDYCKQNKVDLIWFNARTAAVGFYKRMNYEVLGEPFEIKDVGEHYLMFKKI